MKSQQRALAWNDRIMIANIICEDSGLSPQKRAEISNDSRRAWTDSVYVPPSQVNMQHLYDTITVTEPPPEESCRRGDMEAPYRVDGDYPGLGGGVLHWCYSIHEALYALKWYKAKGYRDCQISDGTQYIF